MKVVLTEAEIARAILYYMESKGLTGRDNNVRIMWRAKSALIESKPPIPELTEAITELTA